MAKDYTKIKNVTQDVTEQLQMRAEAIALIKLITERTEPDGSIEIEILGSKIKLPADLLLAYAHGVQASHEDVLDELTKKFKDG